MILTTAALCLAMNIYHEARGEPIMGQYAVALVTMNRAGGDRKRVCNVVLKRKQFSWTTTLVQGKTVVEAGRPFDETAWDRAKIIARVTLSGRMMDITQGATFYHTTASKPYWRTAFVRVKTVGRHIFYRQVA